MDCVVWLEMGALHVFMLRPFLFMGLWCSGITSALHAEGPGFKPRRIHFLGDRRQCIWRNGLVQYDDLP